MSDTTQVDLSAFDVESPSDQGARLDLLDKHGKKSGEWIQLIGADSQEYQKREKAQNQRRLARLQKPNMPRITQAEMEDDIIDRYVICTKDWSFKTKDGQKLPVTPQNVENLYRGSKLIREQVESFINDRSNFIQA